MTKSELRKHIRSEKKRIGEERLLELSERVVDHLEQHPDYLYARTVLLYYSLPDEVSTHALLLKYASLKTILLPVVVGDDLQLRVYQPELMQKGAFGIMEPYGEPFTDYHLIDIALIPGVAFDADGHRLGRGRGYYDRFLSSHLLTVPTVPEPVEGVEGFTPHLIGVCFDFQKVESVPHDANDIPVDMVI